MPDFIVGGRRKGLCLKEDRSDGRRSEDRQRRTRAFVCGMPDENEIIIGHGDLISYS